MSRTDHARSRTTRRPQVADGRPTKCRDGCGALVMWFTTNFGSRVCLDAEPIPDDDAHARYWVDWDAVRPIARSWRKLAFRPDGVGQPKYSTHFDTCPVKSAGGV